MTNAIQLTVSQFLDRVSLDVPNSIKFINYKLLTDSEGILLEKEESIRPTVMGTLIDYLTRLVICKDLKAFDLIKSSQKELVQQAKREFRDSTIEKLTKEQVELATRLCLFEHEFRGNKYINPQKENIEIDNKTLVHIKTMLYRSKNFFDRVGYPKLLAYKCSITTPLNEKPYVEVYGDGDYLLSNALVDFKVSKRNPNRDYIRQLLVYYNGLIERELKKKKVKKDNITTLMIFNPRLDMFYKIDLENINKSDLLEVYQNLHLELIEIREKKKREDKKKKVNQKRRDISTQENAKFLRDPFLRLEDGIHKVSREDYKRFYGEKLTSFSHSGQIILIKKGGYYMFFLETDSKEYLLEGGHRINISHSLNYYYDNLCLYAERVKSIFSPYYESLKKIAKEVKGIGGDGKLHGAIINIDYLNHIYVEPSTGALKYYYATDTTSRIVYPSLIGLLSDSTTEYISLKGPTHSRILKRFLSRKRGLLKQSDPIKLLNTPKDINTLIVENDQNYEKPTSEEGYNKEMYYKSRVMNQVQYLFEQKVVRFWRDGVVENRYPITVRNSKRLKN